MPKRKTLKKKNKKERTRSRDKKARRRQTKRRKGRGKQSMYFYKNPGIRLGLKEKLKGTDDIVNYIDNIIQREEKLKKFKSLTNKQIEINRINLQLNEWLDVLFFLSVDDVIDGNEDILNLFVEQEDLDDIEDKFGETQDLLFHQKNEFSSNIQHRRETAQTYDILIASIEHLFSELIHFAGLFLEDKLSKDTDIPKEQVKRVYDIIIKNNIKLEKVSGIVNEILNNKIFPNRF